MHQPLKGRACVVQPEWHAGIAVYPTRCQEGRFLHVFYRHLDLVIAREGIQEAQQVTLGGGVGDLVDARERERILWAGMVEVGEVDTHAFLSSFFCQHNRVGQPFRIADLANDACFL